MVLAVLFLIMDITVTKESMLILLAEILLPQVRYSAAFRTKNNELVPMFHKSRNVQTKLTQFTLSNFLDLL